MSRARKRDDWGDRKRRILEERAREMRERYGRITIAFWQTSPRKREQMAAYSRAWRAR